MWRFNHQVVQIANANTKQHPKWMPSLLQALVAFEALKHLYLQCNWWTNHCSRSALDECRLPGHGATKRMPQRDLLAKTTEISKMVELSTFVVPPVDFEKLSFIWVSRAVAVRGLQQKTLVTPVSNDLISSIIIHQVSCVTPTYRQPSVELGHPGAAWFLDRSKRSDQYQVFGPIKMRRLKTSWCTILGLESHVGRQIPKHYKEKLQGSIKREWSYHDFFSN